MTRPNIMRADTLDLQDQDNPTASEHQKHPDSNSLAPHLASQINHVIEERNSEDQILQDAWNMSDNLTEEPGAIEEANAYHEHGAGSNGMQSEQDEGGDGVESEGEGDDDMMDRISSSPSIDDGGYSKHSLSSLATPPTDWPARKSSLSPRTPTPICETFNQSAQSTPDSSPFVQTPQHLPLRISMAEDGFYTPASNSTSDVSPMISLLSVQRRKSDSLTSKHHLLGRYEEDKDDSPEQRKTESDQPLVRNFTNDTSGRGKGEVSGKEELEGLRHFAPDSGTSSKRSTGIPFQGQWSYSDPAYAGQKALDQSPSLSSLNSVDLDSVLLPADDPLLDRPPSPNDSEGSWESVSNSDSYQSDEGIHLEDDANDPFLDLDPRFIDSGWGGECLRDTEDIDFEFVYALHTFVATVEGQANATKGDTMVLLDDSNSYWWLVRVVKNSSIGYLPAEHIETPTERLARLNKHRNIDLSATMLSDNSEKSKNPLKKAMRRRNAKTVQFAAPTYVEASDNDYSSDDEEHMIEPYTNTMLIEEPQQTNEPVEQEEIAEVKQTGSEARPSTSPNRTSFDREQAATAAQALVDAGVRDDEPQLSPKLVDNTEAAPLKSRKGGPHKTDSFIKDDETRKITLTPGLLREDSGSIESPVEAPGKTSLESLTKIAPSPPPQKPEGKEKKKEPKKGGMLSGLFKSKKKDKTKQNATDSDVEKLSTDMAESSRGSPIPSGMSSPIEKIANVPQPTMGPRQTVSQNNVQDPVVAGGMETVNEASKESDPIAELQGSETAHELSTGQEESIDDSQQPLDPEASPSPSEKPKDGYFSPLGSLRNKDGKPKKAKRAKQRVELDDFDTPSEGAVSNPFEDQEDDRPDDEGKGSPDSLVDITPDTYMHGTEIIHIPTNVQDEGDEPESLTSSPSIIEHPAEPVEDEGEATEDNDPTPIASQSPQPLAVPESATDVSTKASSSDTEYAQRGPAPAPPAPAVSQETWSDANLRSWLDDNSEVRDMLVMIHDKSTVTPVSADHPLMAGLYVEERNSVKSMMGQLDDLLGSYLQRKGVNF